MFKNHTFRQHFFKFIEKWHFIMSDKQLCLLLMINDKFSITLTNISNMFLTALWERKCNIFVCFLLCDTLKKSHKLHSLHYTYEYLHQTFYLYVYFIYLFYFYNGFWTTLEHVYYYLYFFGC